MEYNQTPVLDFTAGTLLKIRAYVELLKLRLSFLVVFSSAFGYVLGNKGVWDWPSFFLFCLGGFMISGSAVTLNQIFETSYDRVMKRTKDRPLPTGKINSLEAFIYAAGLLMAGFFIILVSANMLTAMLSLVSLILYALIYTPLKRVGPVAVLVGAIPGALPPLLGWTAATGTIAFEALIIFGIQFIWQFPHFWAIAWIADDDYKKAGFKLLPGNGKKDLNTAFQIMIYTLFLIPLGLLPATFGLTGIYSAMIATVCGVLFLAQTFRHMRNCSRESALWIMYGSFIYLPIVQIAFLFDKL
ncbi:MAG: heme o synthase [Cyclobacteriaceae bacterium]|nr:heme o synthase [Cyclobacteriaceae bacterium]